MADQQLHARVEISMMAVSLPTYCPLCDYFCGDYYLYANVEVSKHHQCPECKAWFDVINPLATGSGVILMGKRK